MFCRSALRSQNVACFGPVQRHAGFLGLLQECPGDPALAGAYLVTGPHELRHFGTLVAWRLAGFAYSRSRQDLSWQISGRSLKAPVISS
jgi:hypothetical protein